MREVKEETGREIEIRRVVGLYSKPNEQALAITFEGEVIGGTLQPDHEVSECAYFEFDCLPEPVREHFLQRLSDFLSNQPSAYLRKQ
jgi:8-oxo-dGTP diphosphatase